MVAGPGCVYRVENDTLSTAYCPNEAASGMGGFCAEHAMKNPNNPNRCLRMIPPGEAGNEAGTTDLRCEAARVPGQPPYCTAHQPA